MKNSQFNSIVEINKEYILYNSLYNRVLVLRNISNQILDYIRNEKVENIALINSDLYFKLIKNQFFVDSDIDEFSLFKSRFSNLAKNSSSYRLTINPTMGCTFKCWYCYEEHLAKSKLSENILERVKLLFKNIIEKNFLLKEFHLSFFGGEPLIYFKKVCSPLIMEWKKYTIEHNIKPILSFTTNGYLINESIINSLRDHVAYTYLQITLDGYKDDHDKVRYISPKKGSYDQIVTNIKKLAEENFTITLRINYTSENFEKCIKILQDFENLDHSKRQNIKVSFHCVWQEEHKMHNRYQEIKSIEYLFHDAGFKTQNQVGLNNVKNICYADKINSAVINYNGDVFKCTARPFNSYNREGYLTDEGCIVWYEEKKDVRITSLLKNKSCHTCRILPQCFGGCSQNQIEATGNYCIHNYDQDKIDKLIIDHVKRAIKQRVKIL